MPPICAPGSTRTVRAPAARAATAAATPAAVAPYTATSVTRTARAARRPTPRRVDHLRPVLAQRALEGRDRLVRGWLARPLRNGRQRELRRHRLRHPVRDDSTALTVGEQRVAPAQRPEKQRLRREVVDGVVVPEQEVVTVEARDRELERLAVDA